MPAAQKDKKDKIKLHVFTSTGINILCTANRSQKVKDLYPQIIKLYEEVKNDQKINHLKKSTKPVIKLIRKSGFIIAPSLSVGDVFNEND